MDADVARRYNNEMVVVEKVGSTQILLKDSNIIKMLSDSFKLPEADLHVVEPAYITLSIKPHRNWNIVVDRRYEICVEVFDTGNHKVTSATWLWTLSSTMATLTLKRRTRREVTSRDDPPSLARVSSR